MTHIQDSGFSIDLRLGQDWLRGRPRLLQIRDERTRERCKPLKCSGVRLTCVAIRNPVSSERPRLLEPLRLLYSEVPGLGMLEDEPLVQLGDGPFKLTIGCLKHMMFAEGDFGLVSL